MSRLILVSGKGGVGKTTLATATAVVAAQRGKRTLVASLDRAHNLSDVFAQKVGAEPKQVAASVPLHAIEIDPQVELRREWAALQRWFGEFLRYLGAGDLVADELAVLPGLEELLVLSRLSRFVTSGEYDVVIADLAPTASSLRYLSFPDLIAGRFGWFVRMDQRFVKVFRPLLKTSSLPVPEDAAYKGLYDLAEALEALRRLLQDAARTSVRLVMSAEPIVLEETRRAHALFALFGIHVDAVIANRLLPAELVTTPLAGWLDIQRRVLAEAREAFGGLPVLTTAFEPGEVRGERALGAFGEAAYGEHDALSVLAPPRGISFVTERGMAVMRVFLPHSKGAPPDLKRRDRELVISVGGWRRTIALPESLAQQKIASAKLDGAELAITFSHTNGRTP